MAKKVRNVGGAQAGFERVLASIPAEANFSIAMAADSTDYVYTDLDTNLDDGEAWLIYGGEFTFWDSGNYLPRSLFLLATDATNYCLQVHRNDNYDYFLDFNDDTLMYHWQMSHDQFTTTSGATSEHWFLPFRFGRRTITFSEQLRIIFRSLPADDQNISDPAYYIKGKLYYDRVKAPSIGQSKLGQIANL